MGTWRARVLVVASLCCLIGTWSALSATDAFAAGDVRLSLSPRWAAVPGQGGWTAYDVTVANRTSHAVSGVVLVQPAATGSGNSPGGPVYRVPMTIAAGSRATQDVALTDVTGGYRAELVGGDGRRIAVALASGAGQGRAVAVLSDVPGAAEIIATPLRAGSRQPPTISRFDGARDFPSDPSRLVGLSGVIIDRFDSNTLGEGQLRALRTFVGMGGTLVLGGGTAARQTVSALPRELVPLIPEHLQPASLAALADLAGGVTAAGADVATGPMSTGGRVVLRSRDAVPLVVESGYGAGRIVQLAFDPLSDPFGSEPVLASSAWSQALTGIADPTPSGTGDAGQASQPTAQVSPGPGAGQADSTTISSLLTGTHAPALPPLGLLVALLGGYVLLAGAVNYLALRAAGRRGLMWITTPLLALLFTAGAYGAGYGGRGADYVDNAVQVQRVGPDGAIEQQTFHGIFAPRRGDVWLRLPKSALVAPWPGPGASTSFQSVVALDPGGPRVRLVDVPVWNMRSIQTLSVRQSRAGPPLDVRLRIESGKLLGSVENRTGEELSPVQLFIAGRDPVQIASRLAPGQTLTVDLPVGALATGSHPVPDDTRRGLAAFAARSVGAVSDLTLVGIGAGKSRLEVENGHVSHTSLTAFAAPVRLESSDSLAVPPRQRLLSSLSSQQGLVDVYDLLLPPGFENPLSLAVTPLSVQTGVQTIQVYDWSAATWRQIPLPDAGAGASRPVALTGSEVGPDPRVVRIRVREEAPWQMQMQLTSP